MRKRIFTCALIGAVLLVVTACSSLSELRESIEREMDAQQSQSTDNPEPNQPTPESANTTEPNQPAPEPPESSEPDASVNADLQDSASLNPKTKKQTMGHREVFVADDMNDIITEYLLAVSRDDLDKAFNCIYFEDATFLTIDDLKASIMTTDLKDISGSKIKDIEFRGDTGSEIKRCSVSAVLEDDSLVRLSVDCMLTSDFVWMISKPEIYHADWEIKVPVNVDVYLNGNLLPAKDKFMDNGRPVHIIPCMTKRVSEIYFDSSAFGRYSQEFTPEKSRDRFSFAPEITDELFQEAAAAVKDILEKLYLHMVEKDELKDVAYLFASDTDMSAYANMYADGVNKRNKLSDFVVSNVIKRRDSTCFVLGDKSIALNLGVEIGWMDGSRSRSMRIHTWVALVKEDGQWYLGDIHDRAMMYLNGSLKEWS